MLNKKINIVITSILVALTFMVVGCEKDFDSQENDLLEGNWKDLDVLENEASTGDDLMAYINISPYYYEAPKRKITYHRFFTDPSLEEDSICEYIKTATYTLKGDSLIVRDTLDITRYYKILQLEGDTFIYKDNKDNIRRYLRQR